MKHLFEPKTDTCYACGATRHQVCEELLVMCTGQMTYREWLKSGYWVQEPIVKQPNRQKHNLLLDKRGEAK